MIVPAPKKEVSLRDPSTFWTSERLRDATSDHIIVKDPRNVPFLVFRLVKHNEWVALPITLYPAFSSPISRKILTGSTLESIRKAITKGIDQSIISPV